MEQLSTTWNYFPQMLYEECKPIDQPNFFRVLELLPCVTWVLNRRSQSFDFVSQNIEHLLGHSYIDYTLNGYLFHEANIYEEDVARVRTDTRNFWKTLDKNAEQQDRGSVDTREYRMVTTIGEISGVVEQTAIFRKDADGFPTHLITCLFRKLDRVESKIDGNVMSLKDLTMHSVAKLRRLDQNAIKFTNREQEILKLLCEGKTSRYIAQKLSISFHTVNTHRQKMIQKSGSKNIGGVISYAHANGLL